MSTGTVKWFNPDKGFGFITADEGNKGLFVHQSDIDREGFRSLDVGMMVTYEEEPGDQGPKAVRVKPV
jgi:cold shock protein